MTPIFFSWRFFIAKDTLKVISISLLVTILVTGMWCVRNYYTFDSFVFVSTNRGLNFLLGNNENTRPNAGTNVDISKYINEAHQKGLNEIEEDRFYVSKAIEFIFNNKIYAAKLYLMKFFNYFNFRNELATKAQASLIKDIIMFLIYIPLLIIFLMRLITFRFIQGSKIEWYFVILYISFGMISAIFFTRIRFRIPLDFLLIGIATLFLYQIFERKNKNMVL